VNWLARPHHFINGIIKPGKPQAMVRKVTYSNGDHGKVTFGEPHVSRHKIFSTFCLLSGKSLKMTLDFF
jgi:hypothetical protein